MRFNKYQELAQKTARKEINLKDRLVVAGLGIAGEAGEVAELIKKHIGQGHDLDKKNLIKELGDALWYIAELCEVLDTDIGTVAKLNIDKLEKRYPQGFETNRSINR